MNEVNINIFQAVGSDVAVSSEKGNEIFVQIDKALQNNVIVNLDFSNIKILTTAFLNAAIGQLYSKYKSETLKKSLRLFNISDSDKLLLKKVTDRAKEYFADKNVDIIIKESFNDE
ncbi:MAG: STAS-like domain-containing protein [Bacteroidales bacterium]|nr:STAS-like domain-containing protein [Bacteroidales bacterium]